jgi:pimeloyl-ACP methyl ester carboxylesterase
MTLNRRRLLGALAAVPALTLLPGCTDLVESVADSCPSDPAESGGVTWIPDVAQPVFWGVQNLTASGGAPRDMQIYYPTHHGFTDAPPILKLCVTRWPVVLFLHGQPPSAIPVSGWYRKWSQIASNLARCGYVVVVPSHNALLPQDSSGVAAAMADIAFARNGWAESKWVDKRATSTAVAGHSFGALLGARIVAAHPEIGAFVSLGGGHLQLLDVTTVLQSITTPSFFMWANGSEGSLNFENLDGNPKIFDPLTQPKYAAVYQGEHFDYLRAADTGGALRGPCTKIGGVAADLAALFISANVPVSASRTKVPVELRKPLVDLTFEQEFFAGAHLQSLEAAMADPTCRVDMRWNVNGVTGNRRIGPS